MGKTVDKTKVVLEMTPIVHNPPVKQPQIISSEQLIMVDVDGTLLLWDSLQLNDADLVKFIDPYDGTTKWVMPHKGHVKILVDRKKRGATIVVWSQSGYEWANAAVAALGLEQYVDFIASKPIAIIDDLPASAWLQERIFLSENSQYGVSAK